MAAQEAAQSQQTQGVPESRILQARQANASWLTDPTAFAVNRKPAHSNHRYFLGEATEPKQNLDGVWKVNVTQAASIDVENAPFAAADFNDAGFGAINVPEHLQMAGYLKNKYVNVQYPWDGHEDPQEPNVPENNHVAIYRRSFTLDRPLAATLENGGTVSITFHGMATADKLILFPNEEQWKRVGRLIPDDFDVHISEGSLWMLMNPQANKEHALSILADRMSTPLSRTVSFGDDLVDIAMLRESGRGVAVANANPDVLKIADEICPSNNDDGVAQWVENNLL